MIIAPPPPKEVGHPAFKERKMTLTNPGRVSWTFELTPTGE